MANSMRGRDVDMGKLPAPHWHRKDGGPYIGSGSIVIMRDPDGGWINASIYRVQLHGKNRVTIQFDHQGRHGAIIAKKYWDKGENCPVAIVNGPDPALFVAEGLNICRRGSQSSISPARSRARRSRCSKIPSPACRCLGECRKHH